MDFRRIQPVRGGLCSKTGGVGTSAPPRRHIEVFFAVLRQERRREEQATARPPERNLTPNSSRPCRGGNSAHQAGIHSMLVEILPNSNSRLSSTDRPGSDTGTANAIPLSWNHTSRCRAAILPAPRASADHPRERGHSAAYFFCYRERRPHRVNCVSEGPRLCGTPNPDGGARPLQFPAQGP